MLFLFKELAFLRREAVMVGEVTWELVMM